MPARLALRSVVAGIVLATALASPAAVGETTSAYARTGRIDAAPMGYLGCMRNHGSTYRVCMVTYGVGDGVRIIIKAWTVQHALFRFWMSYTEDIVDPAGLLELTYVSEDKVDIPWLHLRATTPRTGVIDIEIGSGSTGGFGSGRQISACIGYHLYWSMEGAAMGNTLGGGTVGGTQVYEEDCNTYFTESASGWWVLDTKFDEANWPA